MQLPIQLKNLKDHRYDIIIWMLWGMIMLHMLSFLQEYSLFHISSIIKLIIYFFYVQFQRDLPLGIIGSLLICIVLYIGVCLVITGMVPYYSLGADAPLAEAFTSKGLKYVSVLISVGAVAGLTTTLLVGLYVQVNCI